MQVVIIGSGNIAFFMGKLLAPHCSIVQIAARNTTKGLLLAQQLGNIPFTNELKNVMPDADLYIIAVQDGAIATVAQQLGHKKGLVVHTAGSASLQLLQSVGKNTGVIWPIQSIRQTTTIETTVPFAIETQLPESSLPLQQLLEKAGGKVRFLTEAQRSELHVAAVMVSNFTNYFYTVAADFCKEKGIDFALLQPLLQHTAQRLQTENPHDVQTGPAIRKDANTIHKHEQLLNNHPAIQQLYRLISEQIGAYPWPKPLHPTTTTD